MEVGELGGGEEEWGWTHFFFGWLVGWLIGIGGSR